MMNFVFGVISTLVAIDSLPSIAVIERGGKDLGGVSSLEAELLLADVFLASIGVLLAVVSIGLAVLGMFSYTRLKNFVEKQIKDSVDERLSKYMESHDIKKHVEATVQKLAKEEGDSVFSDLQLIQKHEKGDAENV